MNIIDLIKLFDSRVDKKTLVCSVYWMPNDPLPSRYLSTEDDYEEWYDNDYGERINYHKGFLPLFDGSAVGVEYNLADSKYHTAYYAQFKVYGV